MVGRPLRVLFGVLFAVGSIQLGAAPPQAKPTPSGRLTIDKLIDIKHPSAPVWSPDSARVAFLWDRAGVTDVYVVAADGRSTPVQLTQTRAGEPAPSAPRWSADGQSITFNKGGEALQVFVTGGAPRPAAAPRPEPGGPASRDGKRIALVVSGPNGVSEIHVRNADGTGDVKVATVDGPVAGLAWTPGDERLTFTTGGGRGQQIFHDATPAYSGAKIIYRATENVPGPPADNWVVAPTAGSTPAKFTAGGGRGGANRWLDGTHIVADRTSPDFKRRTISVIDVTTNAARVVQEDVKEKFWSVTGDAQAGSQVSPGGKWISFLSDQDGWDQLYVLATSDVQRTASNGSPIQVTKGAFETWRPAWSPDGTRIAFDQNEAADHGRRHIGLATLNDDPAKTTVRMLTSGRGADIAPVWSPDGTKILYQHSDPWNSADFYVIDANSPGAKPVRLTDSMPASIDKAQLVEPQLVHYKGPDGKDVPAYLFVPKNLNRAVKHPAIVWVHGDGVNQNYDGWHVQRNYAVYYSIHQYFLQQGYVVLAPDYRGSIGYGSEWREGVYMDVGGKDFRDAGLANTFLKTLPYVDERKIGIWGLSYGGFFTLLAVTEMPTAYAAAVDVAGVADYALYYEDPYHGTWTTSRIGTPSEHPEVYAQASPVSHMDKLQTPLLVLHGTADVNVPYLHSVKVLDEAMKKGKGDLVSFLAYPGEFHYFTREHVLRDAWNRVARFWEAHLKH
ncbi:MAG: S9 family peptidase [Acidobacteria bacterium]|nr:MAG: S9 family peptidase [Acidobacteriota bacterium]